MFFQKSGSFTFLPLQSPNFMQKIRKIVRAVSEKTTLPTNQPSNRPTNQPTNQPTNYPVIISNTDFIGPDWRRSKKKTFGITFNKAIAVDFSFQVDFADNKLMLPTTFIYRDHGHVRAFYKNFVILVIFQ